MTEPKPQSRCDRIKALSDAATAGPWEHDIGPSLKGRYHVVQAPESMVAEAYSVMEMHTGNPLDDEEKRQAADCEFVVALVNAFRAGELCPVSEKRDWILVSERPPEKATAVLCVMTGEPDEAGDVEFVEIRGDGRWYLIGSTDEPISTPSHWMPLPEAPK
jgi:hypothetical protein